MSWLKSTMRHCTHSNAPCRKCCIEWLENADERHRADEAVINRADAASEEADAFKVIELFAPLSSELMGRVLYILHMLQPEIAAPGFQDSNPAATAALLELGQRQAEQENK